MTVIAPRSVRPRGSPGSPAPARGGILFEALLALVLVAMGAGLYYFWQHRHDYSPSLDRVPGGALLRRFLPSRKAGLSGDFVKDSAWLQRTTRDLLAANGLQDGQVLKSFNQEREMDGIRWLEDTLEMDYPAGFNSARFLKQLGSVLPKKGYRLVRNDKTDKKWILELGASEDVVFQKLVFHI